MCKIVYFFKISVDYDFLLAVAPDPDPKYLDNWAEYLSDSFSANRHLMAGSEYFLPQLWGQFVNNG